jgi:hypothetical protein
MSFEYRELTAQVLLNAGEEHEPYCRHASCRGETHDCHERTAECVVCDTTKPEDCVPCKTTMCQAATPPQKNDPEGEYQKSMGFLRQQLRDTLAAG